MSTHLEDDTKEMFALGFEEGYRMIKGKSAYLPHIPYKPHTPYKSTAFREGIKKGLEKAGAEIVE